MWIVGALALLWNSVGAFDYVMTQTRNASYLAKFPPAQIEFFDNFPVWATAAWALAVWGGVVGSVLLLMRNRLAVPVFLVSMVAMVLATFRNYVLANGLEVFPDAASKIVTAMVFVIGVALYLYARAQQKQGVLA